MQTNWIENVRRILDALPPEKQRRVNAIVNRHLRACDRQGVPLENLERVYIEAVEIAAIDEKPFSNQFLDSHHDPPRRYEQYLPPKNDLY